MKKTLTSITLITPLVPIVSVISCGNNSESDNVKHYHLLPTYTAQADQLIALGVKPDYYPLQLDQKKIFDYLTNPSKYMEVQEETFKNKFASKIASLVPGATGTSWWNQQALNDGERGSDPEYWQHVSGDVVLYEHYLLDDGLKKLESSTSPKHKPYWRTFIETNFRESRDPFTRMPRSIMEALIDQDKYDAAPVSVQNEVKKLLTAARNVENVDPVLKAVDGLPLPSGSVAKPASEEISWIYNDFVYARHYHQSYLDNDDFKNSQAVSLIRNNNELDNNGMDKKATDFVFDANPTNDQNLAKLFFEATYKPEEAGIKALAKTAYLGHVRAKRHHPIYEQQEQIGSAPMFEGAQRENLLYFYNTSAKLQSAFTAPKTVGANATAQEQKEHAVEVGAYQYLQNNIESKSFAKLQKARENANLIIADINSRLKAIRTLVDKANNPTYGIFTLSPGAGQSTIQTISKYSFIYDQLGFKQPLPTNLATLATNPSANVPSEGNSGTLFNMDDNGWWWNLSDDSGLVNRSQNFANQFDLGVITANETQFNNMKNDDKVAVASMFKGVNKEQLESLKVDYNLWNEGLKTPFAIHMLLDHIVKQLIDKYPNTFSAPEIAQAKVWGNYFSQKFLTN